MSKIAERSANPADVESIEAIIAAAYDVISGPAGKKRDWNRERSLFISGARLIPTAVDAGRNDVDLARRFWMSLPTLRGWNDISRLQRSTKKRSRGGSNNSAKSRMSGAHMNRATIRAMPHRSCAGSIAFSFSTMEAAGGSCRFIGSTKVRSTRFRESTFKVETGGSADASSPSAPAVADGCRGSTWSPDPKRMQR